MFLLGRFHLVLLLCVNSLFLGSCENRTADSSGSDLKTEIQKVSYILGYSTGKSLNDQSVDVEAELFLRGMRDGLSKEEKKPKFTDEQMRETMQAFRTTLREKKQKEREIASVKNAEESKQFLAKNKSRDGVKTLESGLQYRVVRMGSGERPKPDDTVVVEYTGSMIDGKEFDSTKERGQPATLPINATVKGMSEALKMMPVGSKWELFVPPELAYGEQGAGAMIGPNQALKFDLELLSIKDNADSKTSAHESQKKNTPGV